MINKSKRSKSSSALVTVLLVISVMTIGLTGCSKDKKDEANNGTMIVANPTEAIANDTSPSPIISPTPVITDSNGTEGTDGDLITAKPEQTTPEPSDQTQAVYYGDWVINKVQAYGPAGTFSTEGAESLIGENFSYSADTASYFTDQITVIDKVATDPIYKETVSSESDFILNYRMSFDKLGIVADTITEVNVSDANGFVCTFLVKDDNTLILCGGGTFFELIRKK